MKNIRIAVDAMGGDHGVSVVVPAALETLARYPALSLILAGDRHALEQTLSVLPRQWDAVADRLQIQHAMQCVGMDESPSKALRTKKNSSMRIAINLVKENVADACVSAGNTGALMATARFVLKTLPGIDRPAIISTFPTTTGGSMRMLDLGANVDSVSRHLLQFAVMGSVLVSALDGIENPRVCLLNIGHEAIKGNELVRETAALLSASGVVNYAGYVEGDEIYSGRADVIVCDGFIGNVALKTTEGVAVFIKKLFEREFQRNIFTRLAGFFSLPVLRALARQIDPDRYNGATFVGLRGIVVKSHGGAGIKAFSRAIEEAIFQAEKNLPALLGARTGCLLDLQGGAET